MRGALGFDGVKPSLEVTLPVRFAGLVLNLDGCTLARDSGDLIPLTRGEFALLRMFLTRPERVISRDALLEAFTNRRFEPFDRSIDVLIGRLRRKIEADPKRPQLIVTVPGEGYRFDGLRFKPPEIAKQADEDTAATRGGARPPRLSIVVLPFANISGDPEQDYFVDGVTETLTTDLSRIRDSFVIGCNTAFTYKGKPVDLKSIRRELTFATFWKEAYSAVASACASTCNCSTPRPAGICGPSGSTSPSPVSSTCKTRSSRALPERSTRSSSMRRRAAPKGHRNPIR
jgi:DNA-binding winged helix-turn-helix (wHTH) protein